MSYSSSVRDANEMLYEPDRESYLKEFKKDNILKAMDQQSSFNMDYRLVVDGTPTYVRMKVMRMEYDTDHIIIGVRNVDSQMRESRALDILRSERTAYNRMNALVQAAHRRRVSPCQAKGHTFR